MRSRRQRALPAGLSRCAVSVSALVEDSSGACGASSALPLRLERRRATLEHAELRSGSLRPSFRKTGAGGGHGTARFWEHASPFAARDRLGRAGGPLPRPWRPSDQATPRVPCVERPQSTLRALRVGALSRPGRRRSLAPGGGTDGWSPSLRGF